MAILLRKWYVIRYTSISKRERAGARKAFSDLVVITHYFVPIKGKDPSKNGWSILREKSKTHFRFNERLLSITQAKSDEFPRSFYFPKDRGRQLQRGFNSSISSIFEDFNWRFLKSMNKQDEGLRTFFNDKKKFELGILNKIDNKALAKTFDELNTKLNDFNVEDVAMSFMDGGAPFNSAFLSQSFEQLDLSMTNLGSGIEMIVSILLLETLASLSKKNIIILIDEPELHLHPSLQEKLINYLKGISDEKQVFISTHSPYFFKNCTNHENINLLVTQKRDDHVEINPPNALNLFPWSPSWGEINYFAYDLPTVEFHNELYGYLQGISDECWINKFDEWLFSNKIPQNKIWIRNDGKPKESITLMTYIRHTIHHPENTCNNGYTLYDLQPIDKLLRINLECNYVLSIRMKV